MPIEYPCLWHYRVIGESQEILLEAAFEIFDKPFVSTIGNKSSKGKYHSLNLEVEVQSKEERDLIFAKLQSDKRIKFVL
ncbi:MAG: DUF493 domain-containing protein [Helicobacter sp.]|nr:DUF493 domain-containing protein [Helicobacter sp.]